MQKERGTEAGMRNMPLKGQNGRMVRIQGQVSWGGMPAWLLIGCKDFE